MMLTDLANAVRVGGIGVWESPGWQGRSHGPMELIRGILIHHTAGGGASDWVTVQNGRPGLDGPLAHMTLERDGGVRILAAGQCWHAGTGSHPLVGTNNGNLRMIGIEGVSPGIGANAWTQAQRAAYPKLAAALCRWYKLPATAVIFHKEWAAPAGRKVDAGVWDPNAFRAEVAGLLRGQAVAVPLIKPQQSGRRRRDEDNSMELPKTTTAVDYQVPTDVVGGWCGKANLILTANTDGNKGTAKVYGMYAAASVAGKPPKVTELARWPEGHTFTQWWPWVAPLPNGTTSVIVNYAAPQGMVARVEYEH